ncbi:hypothetical protein KOW79_001137 [Hemibagrus wyckioides]|uniref:Uncharacterized protein n=1 Tax=Hemibagrus wyckioides TaxID=337641 RepID=A0A9D3P9I8_9TELE|nr:hypothetical protein KOW79_001137 [Hemibagrus wyckioides]
MFFRRDLQHGGDGLHMGVDHVSDHLCDELVDEDDSDVTASQKTLKHLLYLCEPGVLLHHQEIGFEEIKKTLKL